MAPRTIHGDHCCIVAKAELPLPQNYDRTYSTMPKGKREAKGGGPRGSPARLH